ncbi:MAG: ferritin-like domain-containing protein [Nitrososphaerota archaeon]|nr:ferritin-like domain-containing protein [Aigarchaeota archaeon]MDW8077159.1 ferritin-like domain-containing protein [Nitrososphaerota archaeon]
MQHKAKEELLKMLNKALELEHAAYVQYLSHAEIVDGLNCEPIIERLKEIASDEAKHQEIFRTLIGDYLGGVPSTGIAETKSAKTIQEILEVNLEDEKAAVDYYTEILKKIVQEKDNLPYEYFKLEHEVRHVIMDEQEHIVELKRLMGLK